MRVKKLISAALAAVLLAVAVPIPGGGDTAKAAAPEKIGNVTDFVESTADKNVLIFNSGSQQVKVELCTERTVRVQLSLDGDNGYRPDDPDQPYSTEQYYMVQKNEWAPVDKTVTDQGDFIQIKTSAMEIRVQKSPLRIGMYDLEGNLISKDTNEEGMYWDETGTRGVKKVEGTKNAGGIFGFGSGDHGRRNNLNRYGSDFSEFTMSHGRVIAPFFMSTVGYGMFLNTIERNTTFFKAGGGFQTKGYLDYFYMYGPDFKTILNEYAEITGRMELYGKWAHGFMLSKYGNDNATQAEFLEWINRLRDEGYPTDCYVFDYGWRGDVNDKNGAGNKFSKQMWSNDTTKFPDIAAMFEEADKLGFRVGLHNNAGTPEASGGKELYKSENEEKWVKSYMDSVITTGYGDWFWPDEFDVLGSNTAPTFSAKGAYEAWQEYTDESRPMFVTRGSYAGQHYGTAWSGDIENTTTEIGNQIGFSIDTGLIGYWTTSHDLGGFKGRPSNELYTRWVAEFGAWNGIMRAHGHNGREPWTFDVTAQETLKENLKIRYALYPYTYSLAWQGYSQGIPMMRAMLLEDDSQYNPDAWNLNKQYYYGDWFLVAPALDTKATTVSVWLPPETTWFNYYTGERYEGGENGKTITVVADLDEIPVFVKSGAIVPMGPDVNYADEKPLNPLTLDIYPDGETSFTLYEDDGESRKYITENAYSTTKFDCAETEGAVEFTINARMDGNSAVYTPDARSYNLKFNYVGTVDEVKLNDALIAQVDSLDAYNAADEAYWLDGETDTLYVKTADTGSKKTVLLSGVTRALPELGEAEEEIPAVKIYDGDLFELEEADMTGGVSRDTEWKGYTGSGFAKGFQSVGSSVEFTVDIQEAGDYNLVLRANCGKKNNSQYDSTPRQGTMYMDGDELKAMEFEVTGVWGNTVDGVKQGVWTDYTISNVHLEAGKHTFKFVAEGDRNPGNYNLDSLQFNKMDYSVDAFAKIEAESASNLVDVQVADDESASNDQKITTVTDGSKAGYSEVRGEGKNGIKLRVKSSTGGVIKVYETGVGDKVLSEIIVPAGEDWIELDAVSKDTDAVTNDIWLEFLANKDSGLDMEVDWFRFKSDVPEINDGDKFELEDGWGDTNGGSLRVDKEWKGYSGNGYVAGWKSVGNYVEFKVNVIETGDYNLVLGAASGKKNSSEFDSTPRLGALYLNGEKAADFGLPVTSSWGEWQTYTFENVHLDAGIHTFKFRSEGEVNPGNFNLDYLQFNKIPAYKVRVNVNDASMGTVSITPNQAEYTTGTMVTVKASPAYGYEFVNWTVDGESVSEDEAYQFEVTKDVKVIANFKQAPAKKDSLKETIDRAEKLYEDGLGSYTKESAEAFEEALKKAKEVFENESAHQTQVDKANEDLLNAILGLEEKPMEIRDGDIFELEDGWGDTGGGKLRVDTQWPGYSGAGYVAGWKSVGHYVEFKVNVIETGDYNLVLGAASGKKNGSEFDSTPRLGALYLNDEKAADFGLPITQSWGEWQTYTFENIHLEAGCNTFKFRSEGAVNPGNFNLDYLKFNKIPAFKVTVKANDEVMGTVSITPEENEYRSGTSVTVKAEANTGYEFVNWTIDGTSVSENAEYPFTVTENAELVANFKKLPADKTLLEQLITEAEGYKDILDDYTEETSKALEQALADAKTVFADDNATEEQVAAAVDALSKAITGLRLDVSDLEALIEEAEEKDLTNYTKESIEALEDAIEAAKEAAKDPSLTKEEAKKVMDFLQDAMDALEVDKVTVIIDGEEKQVDKGSLLEVPETPEKEGHTFLGWYRGDEEFDFNTPITETVVLTSKWKINSYVVSFDSGVKEQEVPYGAKAAAPIEPKRDGYVFAGWYLGDTLFDFDTPVTENISLTAKWTKESEKPTDPEEPTKPGEEPTKPGEEPTKPGEGSTKPGNGTSSGSGTGGSSNQNGNSGGAANNPATGDTANTFWYLLLILTSGGICAGIAALTRRKRNMK